MRHRYVLLFLLAWCAYVLFSEPVIRAFFRDGSLLFPFLEQADIVFMAIMVLAVLVIPLALLLSWYVRKASGAWKKAVSAGKASAKEKVFALFTLFFMSFILLICWYVVYFHYVTHLESYGEKRSPAYRRPETPGLKPCEIVNLGWAHYRDSHPGSSYILFPVKKKSGITRIGVFGCSFVHGSEVAQGHDLCTFLSRRFKEEGFERVEVINFGVDGYGVHQSYMLWEWVGKRYDLDYTVFLPMEIHESRDRSFVYQNRNYVPVHGRYILDGDDVRLVPVAGSTQREAEEKYFAFIPPWRYLRYDEKMPVSLFSLIPDKGREAYNPLYYRPLTARKEEILLTYGRLFRRLGEDARNAVIVVQDDDIRSLEKSVQAPCLFFLNSTASRYRDSFLYRAPGHHHSAMGQELQAMELFDYLTGKRNAVFTRVTLEKCEEPGTAPHGVRPLCAYDKVMAGLDGRMAAHFGLPTEGRCAGEPRCHKNLDFRHAGICSLLLETDGAIIRFVPLTFLLRAGSEACLSFMTGRENVRIPIGTVNARGGIVGTLSLTSQAYTFEQMKGRHTGVVTLDNRNMPEFLTIRGACAGIRDLTITAGDNTALIGKECREQRNINLLRRLLVFRAEALLSRRFQLLPSSGDYSYLKEGAGEYVPVCGLSRGEGDVQILLYDSEGAVQACPSFLRYRVRHTEGAPFTTPAKHIITLKEGVDERCDGAALRQDKKKPQQDQ